MEYSLNIINGFRITKRCLESDALSYKLRQYRDYLEKSKDLYYSDMEKGIKERLAKIENILVKNKALVPLALN